MSRGSLLLCVLAGLGCKQPTATDPVRDYRADMANFVVALSERARARSPGFAFVLQNGHEILFTGSTTDTPVREALVAATDGAARESSAYGLPALNDATGPALRQEMLAQLRGARQAGLTAMTIDYCDRPGLVDDAYERARIENLLPFAAHRRELDGIPPYPDAPVAAHDGAVTRLAEARNFLYLINPQAYPNADSLVAVLTTTRYDLFIIDAFVGSQRLDADHLARLQRKPSGARRLVYSYLSIGEAEAYRPYFDPEWLVVPPAWLAAENPDWRDNFKVRYWDPDWQQIMFGALDDIVDAGFDGAYLDIIDAFAFFEEGG